MNTLSQYQLHLEQMRKDQLDRDRAQNISPGDIIKIKVGNKGRDGFGVVSDVFEQDGVLYVRSKRLIDYYNNIVSNAKVGQPISVSCVTKLDHEAIDKLLEDSIAKATEIHVHLMSNRKR